VDLIPDHDAKTVVVITAKTHAFILPRYVDEAL
jgi:hypothetical protein